MRRQWVLCVLMLLGLSACIPRFVTTHDGLETRTLDATSGRALSGVCVWQQGAAVPGGDAPLAISDAEGNIRLAPKSRLEFIPLLSEGSLLMSLYLCKSGYAPLTLGQRGGWNADFRTGVVHREPAVFLRPAAPGENFCGRC